MIQKLTCKGCGETKPEFDFGARADSKTGRSGKCKACVSKAQRLRKGLKRQTSHNMGRWPASNW